MRALAPALGLALLAALPIAAAAHELATPRLAGVLVSRDGVRVTIEHSVPAAKAEELRAIYDRDRSGALEAPERELLERYVRLVATRGLAVELDGRAIALEEESARVEIPPRGDLHATIVVRGAWSVAAGEHRIAIRDARDAGVPVSIAFAEGVAPAPGAAMRGLLTRSEPVLAVAFQAF